MYRFLTVIINTLVTWTIKLQAKSVASSGDHGSRKFGAKHIPIPMLWYELGHLSLDASEPNWSWTRSCSAGLFDYSPHHFGPFPEDIARLVFALLSS